MNECTFVFENTDTCLSRILEVVLLSRIPLAQAVPLEQGTLGAFSEPCIYAEVNLQVTAILPYYYCNFISTPEASKRGLNNTRGRKCLEASEAVSWLLHDYPREEDSKLPSLHFFSMIDMLSILKTHGSRNFSGLLGKSRTIRKRNTLISYLNALSSMKLISCERSKYRGVVRTKSTYRVTEKGEMFLNLIET